MSHLSYVPRSTPVSELRLADILGPLSHALDMTEGQAPGHCIRCAWIGTRLGQAIGLEGEVLSDLYFTLLLKDLGCSSNAARICALYLADDISFKRDFKTIDGSLSAALRFVFAKTGLESGLSERFRAIVNILQNGGEISRTLIETRCQRGADIAAQMHFSTRVQDGIRSLDEHWNGSGKPSGLTGHDIPLSSQIALMSQVTDIFFTTSGAEAALAEITERSGTWFDPHLVDHMRDLARDPDLWAALSAPDLEEQVLGLTPAQTSRTVDEGFLDDIAQAFSDVVDAKSPFTADHSHRVALYADMIGEELGMEADHRRWMRRGALLHDLGKLAISNQVLDKPAKLDDVEWQAIRSHPLHGARILSRIPAFSDLAPLAQGHHERLDGKGYPYGHGLGELSAEVQIISVADVFDALSAKRPYRDAMPIDQVFDIMTRDANTAFNPVCLAALKSGLARLNAKAH